MITDTIETSVAKLEATAKIQRLAWLIVLVSFLLFCSISIAFTGGVYYFFFRSSVPMTIALQVGRGTAGIENPEGRSFQASGSPASALQIASTVSTDAQSQLLLSFQIPQDNGEHTLGTITLENNSSIMLDEAHYPRFDWSSGLYTVSFSNFSGEAHIFIPGTLDRPFELYVDTPSGATFLITEVGRYTLSANESSIRLTTHEGIANLLSPNRNENRRAIAGEQVTLRTGSSSPVVQSAPVNLLRNGLFTFDIPEGGNTAPVGWGCRSDYDSPPRGSYFVDSWQNRPALRLFREGATSYGRTSCEQPLELDVSQYSSLELQVTFAVSFQSLQNCGIAGTECPMMLFITFTDVDNVEVTGEDGSIQNEETYTSYTWYQGLFYNYVPQSSSFPTGCTGCGIGFDHIPVSQQVWYTYESGNLFARFAPEDRPEIINVLLFYASGHEYDVYVSELALYASSEAMPPTEQIGD